MNKRLPQVLAIDDDSIWLEQLQLILEEHCDVHAYPTIDQGLQAISSHFFDLVLLDLNFENDPRSGYEVFKHIHAADRGTDVIVVSGETRPDKLIQILNAGVTQFIPKPADLMTIRDAVGKALQQREIRLRAINSAQAVAGTSELSLIGSSPQMQKLRSEIDRVVRDDIKDVLLIGETGTGKEVIARLIASLADPSKRLIPINCGAISDGLAESELFGHVKGAFTGADTDRPSAFEIVGGGFIFLDELGEMPAGQQAKLLRVLQERTVQRVGSHDERKVSFRSISATNVNIENAIETQKFRQDLYFRVAKETIVVPPLRERTGDITELVEFFLTKKGWSGRKRITPEALRLLEAYHWPGNVRQLASVIESLESRCTDGVIREKDVCQALPSLADISSLLVKKALVGNYGVSLLSRERDRFKKALIEAQGDRTKAAQILNVSRATFFRRAKELGLVQHRKKLTAAELN